MAFSYDPSTDAGKVRMLITDRVEATQMFSDAEIAAFLSLEDGSVRLAAADALCAIAADEALVLKKIRTLDLETDGPALAAELRQQAVMLREQESAIGGFEIAELVVDDFSARQRLWNQRLRGDD